MTSIEDMSDLDYLLEKVFFLPKKSSLKLCLALRDINTVDQMIEYFRKDLNQFLVVMKEMKNTFKEPLLITTNVDGMLFSLITAKNHPYDWKQVTYISLLSYMTGRAHNVYHEQGEYKHSNQCRSVTLPTSNIGIKIEDEEATATSAPPRLGSSTSNPTGQAQALIKDSILDEKDITDGARDPVGDIILELEHTPTEVRNNIQLPDTPVHFTRRSSFLSWKSIRQGHLPQPQAKRRLFHDTDDRHAEKITANLSDRNSRSPKDVVISTSNQQYHWDDASLTDDELLQDDNNTQTILFTQTNQTKDPLPFGSPKLKRLERPTKPPDRQRMTLQAPMAAPKAFGSLLVNKTDLPDVLTIDRDYERMQINAGVPPSLGNYDASMLETPQHRTTGSTKRKNSSLWTCTEGCFNPTRNIFGLSSPLSTFGSMINTPTVSQPKGDDRNDDTNDKRPSTSAYTAWHTEIHMKNTEEPSCRWDSPQNPHGFRTSFNMDPTKTTSDVHKHHTSYTTPDSNQPGTYLQALLLTDSTGNDYGYEPMELDGDIDVPTATPVDVTPKNPSNMEVGPLNQHPQLPRPSFQVPASSSKGSSKPWTIYATGLDQGNQRPKKLFDAYKHPDDIVTRNYPVPFGIPGTPGMSTQNPQLISGSPNWPPPSNRHGCAHLPTIGARYDLWNGEKEDDTGTIENFKNFRIFSTTDPVGAIITAPGFIPDIPSPTKPISMHLATPMQSPAIRGYDPILPCHIQPDTRCLLEAETEEIAQDDLSICTQLSNGLSKFVMPPYTEFRGTQRCIALMMQYNQFVLNSIIATFCTHFAGEDQYFHTVRKRMKKHETQEAKVHRPTDVEVDGNDTTRWYSEIDSDDETESEVTGVLLPTEPTESFIKRKFDDGETQNTKKRVCCDEPHHEPVTNHMDPQDTIISPGTPHRTQNSDHSSGTQPTVLSTQSSTDTIIGANSAFGGTICPTVKIMGSSSTKRSADLLDGTNDHDGTYTAPTTSVLPFTDSQHEQAVSGLKHKVIQLFASGHLDGDNGYRV